MEYLKIRNWKRWQTYRKDRPNWQPEWIKVYSRLFHNPEWLSLTDAQRGQLISLWLLAADRNGEIPADPSFVKQLCHLKSEPDLKLFTSLGFIEIGGQVSPTCHPLANHDKKDGFVDDATEEKRVEERRVEERIDRNQSSSRALTDSGTVNGEIFCLIPTNKKGEEFPVTEAKVKELQETFLGVDVPQKIRTLRQWSIDNPTRRKTYGGVPAFLSRNIAKDQDKGGSQKPKEQTPEEHLADIERSIKNDDH